jgi:NAD(P)-dependent dehydrogenase (short-subunit alcohol dehydrogenase family)
MSDSLSGRVAVVTGAARGIGDAIAERLLADGARVFSLDKAAPTEPRDGVVYLEADVTDPASVAATFTAIDAASGRLDILVNNAGIQRIGLVGKVSFADWSAVRAVAQHAPPPSLSQRKSSPSAVKVALSLLSLP